MKLSIDAKKVLQWLKYLLVAVLVANGEQIPGFLNVL